MKSSNPSNKAPGKAGSRKVFAMVVLLMIGLLLWGRLLWKNVPRTAVAGPEAQAAASTTTGNAKSAIPAAAPGVRPTVTLTIPQRLGRDLFAVNPDMFEHKVTDSGNSLPVTTKVEKSPPVLTDLHQRALEAKAKLALQSTIQGERPRAVINGQTLTPGDRISVFVLKRVLQRRVVLEFEGTEIQLDM